jgi:hypothetical protein
MMIGRGGDIEIASHIVLCPFAHGRGGGGGGGGGC